MTNNEKFQAALDKLNNVSRTDKMFRYLVHVFPEKHPILHACVEWTPIVLGSVSIGMSIAEIIMN